MTTTQRKWTARRRADFLRHLRRTGNASAAAEAVGLSRSSAYARRQADADFRAAWDHAMEGALDDLEAELRRRAIEGTERPVFHRGENVGSIRDYSDNLAMFILRSRRPHVYGDRKKTGDASPGSGETTGDIRRRLEERLAGFEESDKDGGR